MMKKILKGALLSGMVLSLFAGNAMAIPLTPALQGVLDGITTGGTSSINVQTDAISDVTDSVWTIGGTGTSAATMIIELAGFAANTTFGAYDAADHTNTVEIFAGANSAGEKIALSIAGDGSVSVVHLSPSVSGGDTGVDFASNLFGWYLDVPNQGQRYFSDTALNPDSVDHLLAYQGVGDLVTLPNSVEGPWGSSEYVLAWEDLLGGGDNDFTDMVLMVESVTPVPEPAPLVIFGVGLAGLWFWGRQRDSASAVS